jgi:gas vesicle protein
VQKEKDMKRPVEGGLSLLIGAGFGMALMYLMDPQEGSDRRAQLQQAAKDRLAKAGEAASAGLDYLHETVDRAAQSSAVQSLAAQAADAAKAAYNEIGSRAGATANDYQQQASSTAQTLHDQITSKLDQLRSKAIDFRGTARSRYGAWLNRSSKALGRDEDHHYVGQTACALGSLALGAGAVYLFDPDRGRERRSQLIDASTHAVRETGHFFRLTGRRLVSGGSMAARRVADRAHEMVWHWEPSKTAGPDDESTNQGDTADQAASDSRASEPANESNPASMGT